MANVRTASKNPSESTAEAFTTTPYPNDTSSSVRSPNNNIFNGAVDAVTSAPTKPIKSRNLSVAVENLN